MENLNNAEKDRDDIRCDICNSNAVIYLPYAKRSLCKKHFIFSLERRVKRTIREYNFLNGVKHLGIAVSGGKDSLTALYVLNKIVKPAKIKLTAILVDEGIAGYRDKTIKDAKKLCSALRVPLKIYTFKEEIGYTLDEIMKGKKDEAKIKEIKKKGIKNTKGEKKREPSCTYCGVFRRWILNKAAKELKIDKIVIGHNLDDVVQSYLMNVFRNEPFRLARFGPTSGLFEEEGFVPRIRPLFKIPEKEIALYSILNNIKTTFVECPYVNESFRHYVRNFINDLESRYPGTKFNILNNFILTKTLLEEKFKREYGGKEKVIPTCKKCGEPASAILCKKCELLSNL